MLNLKEACHALRVTPALLKWFTVYSPKRDHRKLVKGPNATFDPVEIAAFDRYLRAPWPKKRVPSGIADELLIEALGQCPLCNQACEKLEQAHIERKGVELEHHCQHPANVILLCPSCHARYDDAALKMITLGVVKAAKERIVSRKMEAIDRDVELAAATRAFIEEAKADAAKTLLSLTGHVPDNHMLWSSSPAQLLRAASQAVFGSKRAFPELDPAAPSASLNMLSGSVGGGASGLTQAVLKGYAEEAAGIAPAAPSEWELLQYEDDGTVCDLCDPGDERPPALVNYDRGEDELGNPIDVDVGFCDWCNGISVRCHDCGSVQGVLESQHDVPLECEGGCGMRFIVYGTSAPRNAGCPPTVKILDPDDEEADYEEAEP